MLIGDDWFAHITRIYRQDSLERLPVMPDPEQAAWQALSAREQYDRLRAFADERDGK